MKTVCRKGLNSSQLDSCRRGPRNPGRRRVGGGPRSRATACGSPRQVRRMTATRRTAWATSTLVSRRVLISSKPIVDYRFNSSFYVPTAHLFTLKNPTEENMEDDGSKEEDDFQTDDDEDMEVDQPALQKRKKVCDIYYRLVSWLAVIAGIRASVTCCGTTVCFRCRVAERRRNSGTTAANRDERNVEVWSKSLVWGGVAVSKLSWCLRQRVQNFEFAPQERLFQWGWFMQNRADVFSDQVLILKKNWPCKHCLCFNYC